MQENIIPIFVDYGKKFCPNNNTMFNLEKIKTWKVFH